MFAPDAGSDDQPRLLQSAEVPGDGRERHLYDVRHAEASEFLQMGQMGQMG